ncbi:hypothetical protein [Cellulomonas sp. SG140]|uniref:hypothetical protein n=1 Tax=Cellulomonas sp. SG140 TaxID=2976536 RepID=UPI0021E92F08|nr:hypothetical protein [Cellulomonas sp. SG140]
MSAWVAFTDDLLIDLWPDAPSAATTTDLLGAAQEQCEAYAPKPLPATIPARYRQACVMQARANWRASVAGSGDNLGSDAFTVTGRPMDKAVRSLLRPVKGTVKAI